MTIVFRALALLALWLVMETAYAAMFHQMHGWFKAGQKLNLEEVLGTWVGRCYKEDSDRPIATVLEFFYSEHSQHGPAFDGESPHKAIEHIDSEVEPDFYDSDPPSLKDTSSLSSWWDFGRCGSDVCHSEPKGSVSFVKYGDYVVRSGNLDDGVARACYYFRPKSGD